LSHDRNVLALALIGSAAGAANHDLGSRLQSLLMALDELELLAETYPDLTPILVALRESTESAVELLAANRALVRGKRERITLTDLVTRAARRAGVRIALDGAADAIDGPVEILVQAIALVIELASAGDPLRSVPVTLAASSVMIPCVSADGTKLVIATAAIEAAGGRLERTGDQVAISFTSAAVSR